MPLSAQQELNWRFAVTGAVAGIPASDPAGTVYVLTDDNSLHAIKPYSGSLIWTYRANEALTETLLVGPDYTVYVFTKRNRLLAITPGGTVRWKRRFNSSLSHNPATSPDGSILLPLMDGRLIKISGRGQVLWEKNMVLSLTSPIVDEDGLIYVSGADSILYCYSQIGNIKWQYQLEKSSSQTALWKESVIVVSDDGIAMSLNNNGDLNWKNRKMPNGIKPVSIVTTANSVKVLYDKGEIVELSTEGIIEGVFKGPPTSGYASVDENGALYIYGKNKKLFKYYSNDITEMITETKMTPPLIGAAGNLVSGGENWIVYSFISPSSAPGWSGYRGGPMRNGAVKPTNGIKRLKKYYRDFRGYQYYKLMSESPELENRLNILDDFENLFTEGDLINKYPFAPLILLSMAEEGISRSIYDQTGHSTSSSLVRIKAINLLGKIGDIRMRNFLISHLNQENSPSAVISTIWALSRIGFDYDGASIRSIVRVKDRFYNDDGVLLTICDAIEEIIYYNGIVTDQSGLHALLSIYGSDAPPNTRKRAKSIFENFTRGRSF
ncbi:MAG: PQQ-binding-like beta-propeller repeat protein [Deltaproteobacteria bacterium]|nr:PQQ-binding-like beta-propeller repeat protein [Deltaproteobacteria bacterium]